MVMQAALDQSCHVTVNSRTKSKAYEPCSEHRLVDTSLPSHIKASLQDTYADHDVVKAYASVTTWMSISGSTP